MSATAILRHEQLSAVRSKETMGTEHIQDKFKAVVSEGILRSEYMRKQNESDPEVRAFRR